MAITQLPPRLPRPSPATDHRRETGVEAAVNSADVVVYRDADGRQRKESARTLDEARKLKAARTADVARGEFHAASRVRFREYAEGWVGRYQGTGHRGFRDSTRADYRQMLRDYAFPYFDGRLRRRLTEVTPSDVAGFIAWLCDPVAQARHAHDLAVERHREGTAEGRRPPAPLADDARRELSDSTVRNILNPLRSCFAVAVREGKVRHNPCAGAALPHRERVRDDDHEVRTLTREQLATFLAVVHPRHQLMFRLLAATGLRVSELIALQWQHLRLDGSEPCVRVRRALVRGKVEPPKSRHGRRDVPLDAVLVSELRAWRAGTEWPDADNLVFPSLAGTGLNVETCAAGSCAPRPRRPGRRGRAFTRSGIHARRCCSPAAATPCRCSGGSGITPRRSRWKPTCTCCPATGPRR